VNLEQSFHKFEKSVVSVTNVPECQINET